MMRLVLLSILIPIFIGCQNDKVKIQFPDGGYAYPSIIDETNKDFYWSPLKDSFSTAEFVIGNFYTQYFFAAFNEPNLSLSKLPHILFRFTYEGTRKPFIIILTDNEIIVKQVSKGSPDPKLDEDKLHGVEKENYITLKNYFPLTKKPRNFRAQQFVDSIVKIYPKLLDPFYYRFLLNKCIVDREMFSYVTKRIPISKTQFLNLVNLINAAGYWDAPLYPTCTNSSMDGDRYLLEANTENKYNLVIRHSCNIDTSKLKKAYQELINSAHVDIQL